MDLYSEDWSAHNEKELWVKWFLTTTPPKSTSWKCIHKYYLKLWAIRKTEVFNALRNIYFKKQKEKKKKVRKKKGEIKQRLEGEEPSGVKEDLMEIYLNEMDVLIQLHKSWLKAGNLVKVTLKIFWDLVGDIFFFSIVALGVPQVLYQELLFFISESIHPHLLPPYSKQIFYDHIKTLDFYKHITDCSPFNLLIWIH